MPSPKESLADTAYRPIDIKKETGLILDHLQRLDLPVQPTELEVSTLLTVADAFARVKAYVPILVECALKRAYDQYTKPKLLLPFPPKTTPS